MDEHLLYKAFIELSTDRADFLSRLFARPRPAGLTETTPIAEMMDAYELMAPNDDLFQKNLQGRHGSSAGHHKFRLTPDDIRGLEYVYTAFFKGGPDLNYTFGGSTFFGSMRFPTYSTLMSETDERGAAAQLPGHRGEFPHPGRDGAQQRHRADHRRFRRAEGDPRGRQVPQEPRRDRQRRSTRPTSSSTCSSRTTRGGATTRTWPRCRLTAGACSSGRFRTGAISRRARGSVSAPRRASVRSPIC